MSSPSESPPISVQGKVRAQLLTLQGVVSGVETDARKRLAVVLQGATTTLRTADAALTKLGREKWTARAISRRVEAARRAGTATLLQRAATVVDRADKLPATAVEKLVGAGSTSLRALSSRIERAALGLSRAAAAGQDASRPVAN
jgi:hypothetical protein